MRVELVLMPIQDEEPHHRLMFEMPGVPQAGDCLTISRPGQSGHTEFAVTRACWTLDYPEPGWLHHAGETVVGTTSSVTVECAFVAGGLIAQARHAVAGPWA
jgi:hypothetical protein